MRAWQAEQRSPVSEVKGASQARQNGAGAIDGSDDTRRPGAGAAEVETEGVGATETTGDEAASCSTWTRRTVWPARIWSPSLRSLMSTFWPLTWVPLRLPMSMIRSRGG